MVHEVPLKGCSEPECPATYRPHYWGKIAAQDAGWFFQMDGRAWCSEHNPPWVEQWRARKKAKSG